mgnify:CR=1 FL=1
MAEKFVVPYLGKLPLDPNLLKACEEGSSFVDKYPSSPATSSLNDIVNKLILALPVEDEEEDDEDDVSVAAAGISLLLDDGVGDDDMVMVAED